MTIKNIYGLWEEILTNFKIISKLYNELGGNDPQGPRGHEIYNFGRSSLAHHYYIFSLSARCTGVKKIFKDIMHFHFMTIWGHTLSQEPLTQGSGN